MPRMILTCIGFSFGSGYWFSVPFRQFVQAYQGSLVASFGFFPGAVTLLVNFFTACAKDHGLERERDQMVSLGGVGGIHIDADKYRRDQHQAAMRSTDYYWQLESRCFHLLESDAQWLPVVIEDVAEIFHRSSWLSQLTPLSIMP